MFNSPTKPTSQTNIRIGVNEHFHVQHVQNFWTVKDKNSLENDDVCTVHRFRDGLPSMCTKIINWHLHFTAFFQFTQHINHQFNVKSVRMIKIVFVLLGFFMLAFIQNLIIVICLVNSR